VLLLIESYASRLTSEGLAVAVVPVFTDALATKTFDKNIVSDGIMPMAIAISNNNRFGVDVYGNSIELIVKGENIRPVSREKTVCESSNTHYPLRKCVFRATFLSPASPSTPLMPIPWTISMTRTSESRQESELGNCGICKSAGRKLRESA